jgi:predicted Zn-dependent protease
MRQVQVEVAYEQGAEPYTGIGIGGRSLWDFLEENLNALFQGREQKVEVLVPKELGQMQALPTQSTDSYSADAIQALAQGVRRHQSGPNHADFIVLFLNGRYQDASGKKSSVLGVSLSGTSVIAIFKPVVRETLDEGSEFVPKYVEQSTLVHEMGHAFGLVDNGLPAVNPHHDAEHGAHCKNPHCVMYWLHEGSVDLRHFVKQFLQTGRMVVFDDDCLLDARHYRP